MKAFWYNEDRKNIVGLEIRKIRKEKNISIRDLAARVQINGHEEITENTITKIEHGIRFVPDYEINIFAEVLETSPNRLLQYDQSIREKL